MSVAIKNKLQSLTVTDFFIINTFINHISLYALWLKTSSFLSVPDHTLLGHIKTLKTLSLSIVTHLPLLLIGSIIQHMSPTVCQSSSNFLGPNSKGWPFPSCTSAYQRLGLLWPSSSSSQIVWYSLQKRWGFQLSGDTHKSGTERIILNWCWLIERVPPSWAILAFVMLVEHKTYQTSGDGHNLYLKVVQISSQVISCCVYSHAKKSTLRHTSFTFLLCPRPKIAGKDTIQGMSRTHPGHIQNMSRTSTV